MNTLATIVVTIGVASIIGALVYIGRKLQVLDILEKNTGRLDASISNIVLAITEMQTILKSKIKNVQISHSMLEKGSSPLAPTEIGADLIKKSGLESVLDGHKDFLCTKLKASLPKDYTWYDVQEKARDLLVDLKEDPIMNPVKNYVYENPMDIEELLRVGGLWLRDDFLNRPRSINKEEPTE